MVNVDAATLRVVAMGLGLETIRSTAKVIYPRLGVKDRNSAVARGQTLGLI